MENHKSSGAYHIVRDHTVNGQRGIATEGVTTTVFVGDYFEYNVAASEITKYYFAGGVRLAMQRGAGGVKFLLGDHLGSASVVLNADGTQRGVQGYYPWGEINFTEGTIDTEYTYSGQYSYVSSFGMAYFNARWFLPELGRFGQADAIVPGLCPGGTVVGYCDSSTNTALIVDYKEYQLLSQANNENQSRIFDPLWGYSSLPSNFIALDRYAYVFNDPIRYIDPTGHFAIVPALALISPMGWVFIGIFVGGVVVYYAVGGPVAVANGMTQVSTVR